MMPKCFSNVSLIHVMKKSRWHPEIHWASLLFLSLSSREKENKRQISALIKLEELSALPKLWRTVEGNSASNIDRARALTRVECLQKSLKMQLLFYACALILLKWREIIQNSLQTSQWISSAKREKTVGTATIAASCPSIITYTHYSYSWNVLTCLKKLKT